MTIVLVGMNVKARDVSPDQKGLIVGPELAGVMKKGSWGPFHVRSTRSWNSKRCGNDPALTTLYVGRREEILEVIGLRDVTLVCD